MTAPERWVWFFGERVPESVDDPAQLLGGKGAGLHELTRLGFAVPPGFTITTEACRAYFAAGRRWPEGLWDDVTEAVARLECQTATTFGRGSRNLLLAVRSGAPRSMPGMLDTILHCGLTPERVAATTDSDRACDAYRRLLIGLARGLHGTAWEPDGGPAGADRSPQEPPSAAAWCARLGEEFRRHTGSAPPEDPWGMLHGAITAVWNSWEAPRAVHYRRMCGWSDGPSTAVVVQAMVETQQAGVLFTRDPQDPDSGPMRIEAVSGGGDALVRGAAEPVADLLSAPQAARLRDLGRRLEAHFQTPLDVEWGLADDQLVLFQVRPIEPLGDEALRRAIRQRELDRLRARFAERPSVWARHGLGETLPAPTPLTWDLVRRFMSGAGGYGRLYRRLGYRPSRSVRARGFLELAFGRIYADLDRLPELFCPGLPLRYDVERLASDPGLLDQAPTQFDPRATDARFLFRVPWLIWTSARARRRLRLLVPRAAARFELQVLPPFLEYVLAQRQASLRDLSEAELLDLFARRRVRVMDRFAPEAMLPGLVGGWALADLRRRLERLLGPRAARPLLTRLLQGMDDSAETLSRALVGLAEGTVTQGEFESRWGHRGAGEMELAHPRWRADRAGVMELARASRDAERARSANPGQAADPGRPSESGQTAAARRRAVDRELAERLAAAGASCFRSDIARQLERVRELLPQREAAKDAWMRGYELLRDVLEELARRWELGADVYFLTLDELPRLGRELSVLREVAESRRESWRVLQRVPMPALLDAEGLETVLEVPAPDDGEKSLRGTSLSGGTARGPARHAVGESGVLANSPESVLSGYVLICPTVDPGLTPLLQGACGLVVERGGMLSHGALVARQLGIPAVACLDAARRIGEGTTVTVDGDSGSVRWEVPHR